MYLNESFWRAFTSINFVDEGDSRSESLDQICYVACLSAGAVPAAYIFCGSISKIDKKVYSAEFLLRKRNYEVIADTLRLKKGYNEDSLSSHKENDAINANTSANILDVENGKRVISKRKSESKESVEFKQKIFFTITLMVNAVIVPKLIG
uniref:Uncharacterized protein n=1 Tax=Glossina austeni TaxID=7395 RepID=A0A1A9VWI4_GLOAU